MSSSQKSNSSDESRPSGCLHYLRDSNGSPATLLN